MIQFLHVDENDLSRTWAHAFLAIMDPGIVAISPLISTISVEDDMAIEDVVLRQKLDTTLGALNRQSVETVANTIFPRSLWSPDRDRHELFARYSGILSYVLRVKQNTHGTYFQRMVAFGATRRNPTGFNQLEHIIQTYARGNHRASALQAVIFDPERDHVHNRRRGFPCLDHVYFVPDPKLGELTVTGMYATQYIFEKAYGNYLGLYRLGTFMAHEMNLTLRRVICYTGKATLGNAGKTILRDLACTVQAHIFGD